MEKTLHKKYLLGVGFTDAKKENILEYIVDHCKNGQKKWYMVTPNPEILVMAQKNPEYKKALNGAELASVDGVGIVTASRVLGKGLPERFSGVDVVEQLCKEVARKPITVGFLGGRAGVAEMTSECLKRRYPGLKVGLAVEELFDLEARDSVSSFPTASVKQASSVASLVRSTSAPSRYSVRAVGKPSFAAPPSSFHISSQLNASVNILLIAFGSPKQELFIADHLEELPCTVAIGVGGAFDMISGKVARAPEFMKKIGLEWLYRLIRQPWRWKRQLRLVAFVWLVIKEAVY